MARLTITLSDERHRQLKMQAAYRDTTIGALIEQALCDSEKLARQDALRTLQKAQRNAAKSNAGMTDDEVMNLAIEITREVRAERASKRAAAPRDR